MWWDILKNQIASTKGKTFQLDFSQPMVEEEEDDCRKRFYEIIDKVNKANRTDTQISATSSSTRVEKRWIVKTDFPDFKRVLITYNTHELGNTDKIPEEVFCKALEMLDRKAFDNTIKREKYNDELKIIFRDLNQTRLTKINNEVFPGNMSIRFGVEIRDLNLAAYCGFYITLSIFFTESRTAGRGKELYLLNKNLKQTIEGLL
tara:strand:+ start:4386 stop:4997 length:612 start_codon:yes stop_codon:yes gene_type:complete